MEFEKVKVRNEEIKNYLFKAVSESKNISDNLLESCLDILYKIHTTEEELLKRIKELIEMRDVLEFAFLQISTFICQPINCSQIQSMVGYLFREIEIIVFVKMPTIEIHWNYTGTPSLSLSYNPYVFLNSPVWTNATRGKKENMFTFPCDITIDSTTGKIYSADYNNSDIQVYSKHGFYEKRFINPEFRGPRKLVVKGDCLYVVVKTDVILRLNKEDGTILAEGVFNFFIGGFDFWEDTLYTGDYKQNVLHLIDNSLNDTQTLIVEAAYDKTEESKIGIQYVRTQPDGVYLLFKFTRHFLQKFSYSGTLLSRFCPKEPIREPWFFNLDPNNNIILTASVSSIMRIYNQEGEVLKSYEGSSETTPETINGPRGVLITNDYHIVVLNSKEKHCLQRF